MARRRKPLHARMRRAKMRNGLVDLLASPVGALGVFSALAYGFSKV